jgi:parvulin-like peptidyl-prolyl isomerase
MKPENERFNVVSPLGHVESLTSVSQRVARQKEQHQQQHQEKKKHKRHIDEQLEEEMEELESQQELDDDGKSHLDFHA